MSTLDELIEQVESIAKDKHDGHYTIFSFTSCYQGAYYTPDENVRFQLYDMPRFSTLEKLLLHLIANPDDSFVNYTSVCYPDYLENKPIY